MSDFSPKGNVFYLWGIYRDSIDFCVFSLIPVILLISLRFLSVFLLIIYSCGQFYVLLSSSHTFCLFFSPDCLGKAFSFHVERKQWKPENARVLLRGSGPRSPKEGCYVSPWSMVFPVGFRSRRLPDSGSFLLFLVPASFCRQWKLASVIRCFSAFVERVNGFWLFILLVC